MLRDTYGLALILCCLLMATFTSPAVSETGETPPNIVLIMIDDIGAEAIGSYGSVSYETPRIDELASTGVRFENCYASPACTPSRVQIMSGNYAHTTGWSGFINLKASPDNRDFINPKEGSFAQTLRGLGYTTAVGGKWQLARLDQRPDHLDEMGFDEHCMWTWVYNDKYQSRYWKPKLFRNGKIYSGKQEEYGPDVVNEFLLDFIERNQDGPFFVYYPMLLVHTEFHPTSDFPGDPQAEIAKIKKENRAGKKENKKYKNIGKSKEGAKRYFAGMVETADARIGAVIDQLDSLGLRENTVVIITGDNGTPFQVTTEYRNADGEVMSIRGGKQTLTEAGCRVPLIVSWPGDGASGVVLEDLVDFSDFHPTLADLAGAPLPPGEVDGQSFAPQIRGEANAESRTWAHSAFKDGRFVRNLGFKLYDDGKFLDMSNRYKAKEIQPDSSPEAAAAFAELKTVLDAMPEDADRYRWDK